MFLLGGEYLMCSSHSFGEEICSLSEEDNRLKMTDEKAAFTAEIILTLDAMAEEIREAGFLAASQLVWLAARNLPIEDKKSGQFFTESDIESSFVKRLKS
jgi:hypothetical protein